MALEHLAFHSPESPTARINSYLHEITTHFLTEEEQMDQNYKLLAELAFTNLLITEDGTEDRIITFNSSSLAAQLILNFDNYRKLKGNEEAPFSDFLNKLCVRKLDVKDLRGKNTRFGIGGGNTLLSAHQAALISGEDDNILSFAISITGDEMLQFALPTKEDKVLSLDDLADQSLSEKFDQLHNILQKKYIPFTDTLKREDFSFNKSKFIPLNQLAGVAKDQHKHRQADLAEHLYTQLIEHQGEELGGESVISDLSELETLFTRIRTSKSLREDVAQSDHSQPIPKELRINNPTNLQKYLQNLAIFDDRFERRSTFTNHAVEAAYHDMVSSNPDVNFVSIFLSPQKVKMENDILHNRTAGTNRILTVNKLILETIKELRQDGKLLPGEYVHSLSGASFSLDINATAADIFTKTFYEKLQEENRKCKSKEEANYVVITYPHQGNSQVETDLIKDSVTLQKNIRENTSNTKGIYWQIRDKHRIIHFRNEMIYMAKDAWLNGTFQHGLLRYLQE